MVRGRAVRNGQMLSCLSLKTTVTCRHSLLTMAMLGFVITSMTHITTNVHLVSAYTMCFVVLIESSF